MIASVEMKQVTCETCLMVFWMPTSFEKKRRTDGKVFYCPQGHTLSFADNDMDRMQKELERAKGSERKAWGAATTARDERDVAERSVSALKGVVTRMKNQKRGGKKGGK